MVMVFDEVNLKIGLASFYIPPSVQKHFEIANDDRALGNIVA